VVVGAVARVLARALVAVPGLAPAPGRMKAAGHRTIHHRSQPIPRPTPRQRANQPEYIDTALSQRPVARSLQFPPA